MTRTRKNLIDRVIDQLDIDIRIATTELTSLRLARERLENERHRARAEPEDRGVVGATAPADIARARAGKG